jgi:hypothetical protein
VTESDPRVAALRDQARADAADLGMSEARRLREFPIGPDAAWLGGRWAWQQVGCQIEELYVSHSLLFVLTLILLSLKKIVFMLLSVGAALLGGARLVLAWFVFSVDVERRCAVIHEDRMELLELSFFPMLAFFVVGLLPMGSIAIRLWGPSAFLRIIWRQTVIFYGSNARVGLCGALGVLGLGLNGSVESASYIVVAVGLVGALDLLLLLSQSTIAIRMYALALMSNYGIYWLQERLLLADCDLIGTDTRQSLESRVLAGTAVAGHLLFILAILALSSRRAIHPRRPLSQTPRLPYSSEFDLGSADLQHRLTYFYNFFEMRAVRTGGDGHRVLSDPKFDLWSFEIFRLPSLAIETGMIVCYAVSVVSYAANFAIFAIVAFTTGSVSLRCFSDSSAFLATMKSVSHTIALTMLGLLLLTGIWQWIRVVRRPWASLARYFWSSIMFNFRSFALIALVLSGLSFFPASRASAIGLAVVFLVPLLDAFSHCARRKLYFQSVRTGVVVLMIRAIVVYIFEVVVTANLCSNEDRLSVEDYVLSNIGATLKVAWNISLLAILSRKMRDPRRPFFDFRLQEGVGFDVEILFSEPNAAAKKDAERGVTRQRHARSVEMRTRSGSAKLDVVAPTML